MSPESFDSGLFSFRETSHDVHRAFLEASPRRDGHYMRSMDDSARTGTGAELQWFTRGTDGGGPSAPPNDSGCGARAERGAGAQYLSDRAAGANDPGQREAGIRAC